MNIYFENKINMKKYISLATFLVAMACLEAQAMDEGLDPVAVPAGRDLTVDQATVHSFFTTSRANAASGEHKNEIFGPNPDFISPDNQIARGSLVWKIDVRPTVAGVQKVTERLEHYLAEQRLNFIILANATDADRWPFLTIFAKTPQEAGRYIHEINDLLTDVDASNFLHGQAVGYGVSGYGIPDNMLPVSSERLTPTGVSHIVLTNPYIPMTGAQQVSLPHQDYFHRLHSLMADRNFFGAAYTISLGDRTGGIDFWPLWFYDDVEGQEPELFLTQQIMAVVRRMVVDSEGRITSKNIGDYVMNAFLPPSMFAQDIPLDDWMHSLVCAAIAGASGDLFTRSAGGWNMQPDALFRNFLEYISNYKINVMHDGAPKLVSFSLLFKTATGQNLEALIPVIQSYFLQSYWGPMHAKHGKDSQKGALADAALLVGSAPKNLARQGSGGGGFASVVAQVMGRGTLPQ